MRDHSLLLPHEARQPPITPQPQHQPHGPGCLVILPIWIEMGGGPVCVCVCVLSVCVLSVCA